MSIEEASALCEQRFPKLGIIATHHFQVCHHDDGKTSRVKTFCISAIPNNKTDDVRRYESPVGFDQCTANFIANEPKA